MQIDIAKIRTRLQKKIASLQQELHYLQETCPHTNKTSKYNANTGNYDPSADCYWIEHKCPDCGKCWWEDQ